MIENLPNWINWLFLLTAVLTIGIFHYTNGKPNKLTYLIIIWSLIQSILAFSGFYEKTDLIPPRFLIVLIPVFITLIYGLTKRPLNWIIENKKLNTFIHTIRLPVEIVLLYLYLNNMMPELMTFEGRNFDILAGISAPIIGILFLKNIIGRNILIIWNMIGLFLILFVFANGILSSELPIQMFGFEKPTKAPNYFPFILLPATIVPIVIYSHITDIIKLWKEKNSEEQLV
ncbi:hypothetical protein [Winogradskyella flava]|uniref:Uncharacterized protein n=1 Tax=Winogradskyella flava TaxID=1884876 RepID=A0A842IX46_9FLAO|nr:hypothetical protein [Winogradskyella flava]MBC2846266.1 hypothetical protein [Winogradskyella flava]